MVQPPTVHSNRVIRQMDHLIMALKVDPQSERPNFLLSLYWIGFTVEAGEPDFGHVAYLWSGTGVPEPGGGGVENEQSDRGRREAVLTDNPRLLAAIGTRLRPAQWTLSDPDRSGLDARFERQSLRPYGIGYRITAAGLSVEARWQELSAPVFAIGPTRGGDAWIATMLVESFKPSAEVDGLPQPGKGFPNPIWRPWFGDERGSCIIGLGETIYERAPGP